MKEDKFRIERFGCTSSEKPTVSTETCRNQVAGDAAGLAGSADQRVSTRHNARRTGKIAACLLAAFLVAAAVLVTPATSSAQVAIGVSVSFGPPALPYYVQPPCPAPGYIWTPGYWAWDPAYGYYWVPGTWVPAPFVGALWTPGYWAFNDGRYFWYAGYWGPVVGYYGGINYGYGYTGRGYYGGYWNRGAFYYNRSVNRIEGRDFRYVYQQRVVENSRDRYVSYHGGPGGTMIGPTANQLAAARYRRFGAVNQQVQLAHSARTDRTQWASVNHGRPNVAATPRPEEFRGRGNERATRAGAPYQEPARNQAYRPVPNRESNGRENVKAPSAPREIAQPTRTEQRYSSARQRPEPQQQQRYNQAPSNQRNQAMGRQPEARRQPQTQNSREKAAHPSHNDKGKSERDHGRGH